MTQPLTAPSDNAGYGRPAGSTRSATSRVAYPRFMSVRPSILLAAAALLASACGSGSEQPATPSISSTVPVTTSPGEPAEPASFADIEDEYDESVRVLLAAGRAAVDEVVTNDPDGLHARFDQDMAAELPIEDLRATLDEMTGQAPLSVLADRAFQQSPAVGFYRAELDFGPEVLALTFFFNEEGEVFRLDLEPQPPLPPDPAAGYASEVAFRLPVEGLWFVFWGGDTTLDNYHVVAPGQRHAYDIVVWNDGGTHSGDGSVNEDYWAYGQPVFSPAAGTVVTAIDGLPDQTPQLGRDEANPVGNHVVIEVADGEYLLIAHMQPGSLTVAEGDTVESGQQIGLVGNSGNTSEPHIHLHLQDQPTFNTTATGLPLEFTDYLADGQPVERGQPTADQFIAAR